MAAWGAQSQGTAAGVGTGAASGALMGTMIAPGVGTAVGAVAGGLIGGLQGALGGSAKKKEQALLEAQQRAIQMEQKRRDKNVGQVRDIYGALPVGKEKYRNLGTTLQNLSGIEGNIEQQALAARDVAKGGMLDTAQTAAAAVRGSSSARGLLGSSIDAGNRQKLLGSYLGGRLGVADAAAGTREAGHTALNQEQMGLESTMRQGGNLTGVTGALGRVSSINQARSAIPYQALGNLVGDAMDLTTQGAKAYQQGGQGLTAVGLYQPRLGGGVPGAYQPRKGA